MIQISAPQAATIERRLAAGEPANKIAADFGLLDQEVVQVAERVRTARAARNGAPPTTPTLAEARPRAQQGSAPGRLDVDEYLEHDDKRIAKAAAAAHKAVDVLTALVAAYDAAESERKEQERLRAEATAAVGRLERELAEARERLKAAGGASKRSVPPPVDGPASAEIRAWAAEQGIHVPPVGRIPSVVRESYLEAHPDRPAMAQEAS